MPFRIDCGFRNRLLLGLAIWFSKTEPLVASAASCYRFLTAPQHPVQLRGCAFYFEAAFLSSGHCRSVSPLHPVLDSASRCCALLLPFGRGAEPTSLRRPVSTCFVDSFSDPPRRCRLRDFRRFVGERLLPPPRWESTRFVDFVFRLSLLRPGDSVASATSPFRPRGRGFYRFAPRESTARSAWLIPPAVSFSSRTGEASSI